MRTNLLRKRSEMEINMQNSLHFQMMIAQNAMYHRIHYGAMKTGLCPGQPKILEYLSEHDGCQQSDLVRDCELTKATIAGIVRRMEHAGLIRRESGQSDARCVQVFLTPKGMYAVQDMEQIFTEVEGNALEGVSLQDKECFMKVLRKIHMNLTEYREG